MQQRKASTILIDAIDATRPHDRPRRSGYDRKLLDLIYDTRIAYVLSSPPTNLLSAGARDQLISITRNRYPKERTNAVAMSRRGGTGSDSATPAPPPTSAASDGSIDGNAAAANGAEGLRVRR